MLVWRKRTSVFVNEITDDNRVIRLPEFQSSIVAFSNYSGLYVGIRHTVYGNQDCSRQNWNLLTHVFLGPTRWVVVLVLFLVLEAKAEYRVLKGYFVGEPYDYGSVMHYGFNFFSIDPRKPTMIKLMPGGKQMGQRDGFSRLDLRKINKFYNCTKYISEWRLLCAKISFLMSDEFLENLYVLYHLVYFIIFAESIPKPAKEIIKIVSGMYWL